MLWFATLTMAFSQEPETKTLTVDLAVRLALDNNPLMDQVSSNEEAASQAAKATTAAMLPRASADYGFVALKDAPFLRTNGMEIPMAHQDQYNWGVSIIQPLFTGFALTSQRDMARLEVGIKKLEKEQAVLDLVRQVKGACYNLLLTDKLFLVAQDEVAALEAHVQDAKMFYRHELIPKNDFLESQVALAEALQAKERADAGTDKAAHHLNRLLNRTLTIPVEIEDILTVPELDLEVEKLQATALANRPVLRSVRLALEQLGFAKKLAESAWYPQVAVAGRYEQNGDSLLADSNDYSNDHNSSVAVTAQWNFWDWGETRAKSAEARHHARALEANIESLRTGVSQEVHAAILDCQVAWKNVETARIAVEQAQENWRITKAQYQKQVVTSTQVLDARTYLTRADTNYYLALYGYMDARAQLKRATGSRDMLQG